MFSRLSKVLLIFTVGVVFLTTYSCNKDSEADTGPKSVKVTQKTIVEKALAVGTLEPENEISVKSKVSGVVQRVFAEEGDFVKVGDPLLEIKPDPTPMELAEATRNLEIADITYQNAKRENDRVKQLQKENLISTKESEDAAQAYDEAEVRLNMAKERLAILEEGKVNIAGAEIESVIKAPISGFILEKNINIGDPVVPLTSYQEGTVLHIMANMEHLLFKGTVDEIDVGKLRPGLPTEINVGAIQGEVDLLGTLDKISLKAKKENNTSVFPIEVRIKADTTLTLRAGYSANAEIIIDERKDVLTIPERVVTFRNDSAFVIIPVENEAGEEEIFIETGLSDAIDIEVKSGLEDGQTVLEKPVKTIE